MNDRQMTQTDVWALADISPAVLSRYLRGERGRRMNSQAITTVEKLAKALSVEPEYFVEYRAWKAQKLVREAMAQGLIDLEDIELILAGKRYRDSHRGE